MIESSAAGVTPTQAETAAARNKLLKILVPVRKRFRINQAEVATAMGIQKGHLSLIETGAMNSPDPSFPDKYGNALIAICERMAKEVRDMAD